MSILVIVFICIFILPCSLLFVLSSIGVTFSVCPPGQRNCVVVILGCLVMIKACVPKTGWTLLLHGWRCCWLEASLQSEEGGWLLENLWGRIFRGFVPRAQQTLQKGVFSLLLVLPAPEVPPCELGVGLRTRQISLALLSRLSPSSLHSSFQRVVLRFLPSL